MTAKEIILEIYQNDGLRNREMLNNILHQEFSLEWQNSVELSILDKEAVLNLADELKNNFSDSKIEIKYVLEDENKICIAYNHFATTIENTRDIQLIARFISIWEFENGKILKGYQISKPT